MNTFTSWMEENFETTAELEDIVQYGCSAGFGGLTYYSDTTKLYDQYEDEIWEVLAQDAEDFGHKSTLEFIASFNGANDVHGEAQFKNLLVWYMAERVAQHLIDQIEEEIEDESNEEE